MKMLLRRKFDGSSDLKAALLATGDAELVEWIASKEGFWGSGIAGDPGKNTLGKLLMELRDEYKNA